MARFPIRVTGANQLMGVVGMTPSRCDVDVDDTHGSRRPGGRVGAGYDA
jgi:hypothetical protein